MHIEGNAFLLGKLLWDIKLRGEKGVVFYHENLSPDDQRRFAARLAHSLNVDLALDILTADKSDLFELRHRVHIDLEAFHPEDIVAAFEFGFELSGYCLVRGGHPNPSNPADQGAKPENIAIVENKLRKRAEDAHVDWRRLETIVAMAKNRTVGTDEFLQATGQTIVGLLEYFERKGSDQPPPTPPQAFVSYA